MNPEYDPEKVGIEDLLTKEQIFGPINALRMGGRGDAGIFIRRGEQIHLIDALYGDNNHSCMDIVSHLAEKVFDTGQPQQNNNSVRTAIAHPLWLHYQGKSYLKGCLSGTPPAEVSAEELVSCSYILSIISDAISEKMSAAFASAVISRDQHVLEERFHNLDNSVVTVIENASAVFALLDPNMVMQWHNASLKKCVGEENVVGRVCYNAIFGNDAPCPGCLVKKTFATGLPQTGSLRIESKLKGVRYYQFMTAPVRNKAGEVEFVLELVNDITEAHETESELARYKRLVNNSEDFMVVCNGNFKILAANRKLTEESQYTEKDLIGSSGFDLVSLNEHDKFRAILSMLRVTGMAMGSLHLIRKDGSLIPTQVFITYDSETAIYEAVFRDVTERLHLEREIRTRSEELQAQNTKVMAAIEEKNRFFRNVSHELRTPLTSVMGFAELLLEDKDEPLSNRQKMLLEKVVSNSLKLLSMVNDLLDLSRLDAGRMKMEWSNVEMDSFLGQTIANMMPLAKSKNLLVSVSVPKKLPSIMTDENKLGQIIVNLLSNAIKFTAKGSITIKVMQKKKTVSITVSDTGVGIPEKELTEIFKEFSRGSNSDSKNVGTGLGLAIAKRLSIFLGGEISVSSKVGAGSTFTLTLPISPNKVMDSAACDL
jgi:PAS domain S-box-containing protein